MQTLNVDPKCCASASVLGASVCGPVHCPTNNSTHTHTHEREKKTRAHFTWHTICFRSRNTTCVIFGQLNLRK